ncbi:fimbrial protein [Pseudomonas sp. BGr12]|uniref:fimbrial protein n=1 Tax=unclassified Pseudomonas TaxID=196821 RepID=UPI00178603EC|nr:MULTISPECIES: fimbrial protein [unclassified Pseudomonas]MBD9578604.1 fimbrial protein [Pseudomonas sp. PDM23]MBD9674384.1 fimbrial protein [Pseudomonas sp. PDM21]MDL2429486.1 fimbrial protein [Pseudomonas sp. BJa5]
MNPRQLTHWRTYTRSWSRTAICALALAVFFWGQNALAAATCTFNGTGAENFTFPGPISVPRDNSASMAPLSNWVTGEAATNIYTCTLSNSTKGGIGIKFPTMAQAGSYSEGGITYKVFNTSVQGVGIVYGFRLYTGGNYCDQSGGVNGWNPWGSGSGSTPYSYRWCDNLQSGSYSFGAQLRFRLIQTGRITAGTVPTFTMSNSAQVTDGTFSTAAGSRNYVISPVAFQALSCTAVGANVTLDTAKKSDFTDATSVRTKPFQFTLQNCPAGMNSIKYQLDPIGTIISATDGTFQNATGADMAKGVGLRITNEANTAPVRFGDSSYTVANYSPTSGNTTLPIKMNVSYYRTGAATQVTGGKVRGTAQLTVFYL